MSTDALDAVYATVPTMRCKGLCQDCCRSVAMTEPERARIEERHGIRIDDGAYLERGCPALGPFGHCRVYPDRPLVCRLWGAVPSMRCPYGCEPEGGLMTEGAAGEAVAALHRNGRAR